MIIKTFFFTNNKYAFCEREFKTRRYLTFSYRII